MKKAKMIMAFTLALSLCSVMTACGNANEENSSSVSSSTVETTEEPTTEEPATEELTTEEPTTEEPTTEEPTTEEITTEAPTEEKKTFTPLVENGENVTLEILEQIPDIYGMSIDDASEAIMTSLNFHSDNKEVIEASSEELYNTLPDGYESRITYRYDVKDCNLNILDGKCDELILNAYYGNDNYYTFELGFVFNENAMEIMNSLVSLFDTQCMIDTNYDDNHDDSYDTPMGRVSISFIPLERSGMVYVFITEA